MIRFGPHYYPTGMKTEITSTFTIIDSIADKNYVDITVSSGIDRKHGRGSLHYVGLGVDITWQGYEDSTEEADAIRSNVVRALKDRLGAHYDVVREDNHIHIEYQPKTAVNEHWR